MWLRTLLGITRDGQPHAQARAHCSCHRSPLFELPDCLVEKGAAFVRQEVFFSRMRGNMLLRRVPIRGALDTALIAFLLA